eukprot:1997226-Prymnesium_polylepis.1
MAVPGLRGRRGGAGGGAGDRGHLVLEKVIVEVAIKAAREGMLSRHPVYRVGEVELGLFAQRDRVLARQVDLDDPVAVERDGELFVRVDERLAVSLRVLAVARRDLADHAPHREIVNVPLVPVVIAHRVLQLRRALLVELHRADLCVLRDGLAERELEAAADEVVALEHLAQAVPAVLQLVDRLGRAEGQRVVHVCLLRVVVRADLVDPHDDILAVDILVR